MKCADLGLWFWGERKHTGGVSFVGRQCGLLNRWADRYCTAGAFTDSSCSSHAFSWCGVLENRTDLFGPDANFVSGRVELLPEWVRQLRY